MATNEQTTLGKLAMLTAKVLSGWRVPSLKDVKAAAVLVLKQRK
jgi:hypothetical protein